MNIETFRSSASGAADLLRALANEHRLMILCRLAQGELSVGELEAVIQLRQSALSQHLARLRHDGLVKTRRESQTIYYSLASDAAQQVIQVLYGLYCETPDRENAGCGDAPPVTGGL